MGPLQRTPGTASTAFSQDPPWLRRRERISLVKNRMREICTSGSVRDGDGNAPIYSAFSPAQRCQEAFERSFVGERSMVAEELDAVVCVSLGQHCQKPPPEQAREHIDRHEEARPRRDPAPAILRQSATRHDHVHVRMMAPTLTIP